MPAEEAEHAPAQPPKKRWNSTRIWPRRKYFPGVPRGLGISGCGRCRPRVPARELDPNLARARHGYATFLIEALRPEDALAEMERARQLDPSSKAILADRAPC